MPTSETPPESAEPAPVATDTQPTPCPACAGDGYTGWSWGSKDTCSECAGIGKRPATPAPAGDADEQRGLYRKYEVRRLHDPTGKHTDCTYFVLDEVHDEFAGVALRAYADACAGEFPQLARDLRRRHCKSCNGDGLGERGGPCLDCSNDDADEERDPVNGQLVSARVAPAGDAEVNHEQAREALRSTATLHVIPRYISQQEARQQRADQRIAELTEDRRVQRVRAADAEIALTEERSLTAELRGKLEEAEREARQNARLAGATRRVASGLLEAFPQHFEKDNNALLDAAHEARACLAELWPDGSGPQFPPAQSPPASPLTRDEEATQEEPEQPWRPETEHPLDGPSARGAFALLSDANVDHSGKYREAALSKQNVVWLLLHAAWDLARRVDRLEAARLTPDDVRTIAREVIAEVAGRACVACAADGRGDGSGYPLGRLSEAAKEESAG